MPYLFAHNLCAKKTRALLDVESLPLGLYDELYRWGAQGPDLWFYHRPLNKKRTLKPIGNEMHAAHIEQTLSAMLDACPATDGQERLKRFAYFSGFLTHYALDALAHPYIICRSGEKIFHTRFECEMDVALLEQAGDSIRKKRIYDQMPPVDEEVVAAMQEAAVRAWGKPLPKGEAALAVRQARRELILLNDPRGWKRRLVRALETLIGRRGQYSRGIYPTKADPARDVLNLQKQAWHVPWSGEVRWESFSDLLNEAVQRSKGYIEAVWRCLSGTLSREETLKILGGFSMDNGLPWRESNVEYRCFDGVYHTR